MEKIKSFETDHDYILPGMYISRTDSNITTYDIRIIKPNCPPYLENDGIHTFEHLFATYARNSIYGKSVVYVGPMGCRTGFYLLTKDLNHKEAIDLVKKSMNFIENFKGNIPGASKKECGNYLDHNLQKAKKYAQKTSRILKNWDEPSLYYK